MVIARAVAGILVFVLMFLTWLTIQGLYMSFSLFDLSSIGAVADWFVPAFAIAAITIIAGAVAQAVTKNAVFKWVSLVGGVVVVVMCLLFLFNGDIFGKNYYGPTIVPWIEVIIGAATAVTCFIDL